jgi:hypothetical protein
MQQVETFALWAGERSDSRRQRQSERVERRDRLGGLIHEYDLTA